MGESTNHIELKKMAHLMLYEKGFKENQIKEEFKINIRNAKRKFLIVDVVGLKKENKIAIEVGNTPLNKLIQLELFFDEVVHIPYGVSRAEQIDLDNLMRLNEINENQLEKIKKLESVIEIKNKEIHRYKVEVEWEKERERVLKNLKTIRVAILEGRNLNDSYYKAIYSASKIYYYDSKQIDYRKEINDLFNILFKNQVEDPNIKI